MIAKPNLENILSSTLTRLATEAGLTNTQKGSVTRILTEAYLTQIVNLYDYVDQMFNRVGVSTAQGAYLDLKGDLMRCFRTDATETDSNYRYRITRQPYVIARENLDAIEQNLLKVNGVKRIEIDSDSLGGGYFDVYILTDEVDVPETILSQAQVVVDENKARGVIATAREPFKEYCDISLIVDTPNNISSSSIQMLIENYVSNRLNNIYFGGSINFGQLCEDIQEQFNFSRVSINSIKINNTPIFNYTNFKVGQYSRLVFQSLDVNAIE
jgi:uncharacterized phage protein gp47/JayE